MPLNPLPRKVCGASRRSVRSLARFGARRFPRTVPLARLAGEGGAKRREREPFHAERSDAHFFQPSSRNNAQGKVCGASRRRMHSLSRPCRGVLRTAKLPRQAREREASGGADGEGIAQINADGLPRAFGPRNDEMLAVWRVSVGDCFAVAGKKARSVPILVIARRVAPWQSSPGGRRSSLRRERAHANPLARFGARRFTRTVPLARLAGEGAPQGGRASFLAERSDAHFPHPSRRNNAKRNICGASRRRGHSLSRPCQGTLPRQAREREASGGADGEGIAQINADGKKATRNGGGTPGSFGGTPGSRWMPQQKGREKGFHSARSLA
jgi:hypothetical protein